jgi:hypothetical protein
MQELSANNQINRLFHVSPKKPKGQRPVAGSQKPVTRNQKPEARSKPPATRNRRKLHWIPLAVLGCLLWVTAATAQITEQSLPDAFTDIISKLSSLADRSTGTAENQEAALYIKKQLEQLGYEDVGSYRFSVPVIRNEKSTLSLPSRNIQIDLRPITGNAVMPQTVALPGFSGPLIYAGRGDLKHLNGKQIADSIILMELDSGKNDIF